METVLVIDDDRKLATLLDEVLSMNNYTVILSHSGTDGVHLAQTKCPDVILCDMNIPGLNGYQVLDAVRAHPAIAATRFYFLSGQNDIKVRAADGVIPKPFHVENLLRIISTVPA